MALTPEQFNLLATKDDLKDIKEEMTTKEDTNKVLTAVDGLAKKFDNFSAEMAANQAAHDRYEDAFLDLKTRVRALETKKVSNF